MPIKWAFTVPDRSSNVIRKTRLHIILALVAGMFAGLAHSAEWQTLSDTRDLNDWRQVGGDAEYRIDDKEIVGTAVPDSPNSFLTTKKTYSDFVLEFEVFGDPELNSGVQIRSHVGENGVVEGYQVEIDPSPRAFSGGLYDEQRRRWMYPLSRNEKGRKAFQNGRWNRFGSLWRKRHILAAPGKPKRGRGRCLPAGCGHL